MRTLVWSGKSLLINTRRARITLKRKGIRCQSNTTNLSLSPSSFDPYFCLALLPQSSPSSFSYSSFLSSSSSSHSCSSSLRKKIRCWSNTWKLSPFISCSSTFFRSQQLLIPATSPKLGAKLFPALRANKAITPWSTKEQTCSIWSAEYQSH